MLLKEFRGKTLLTIMKRLGNTTGYEDTQRYLTTVANEIEKNVVNVPMP